MPAISILLIEDNPADVRLLREYLIEAGADRYQITHATRLADGIDRLSSGSVDVILLDLGLPDSQGLDTFYRVHTVAPDLPIILLTGLQDERTAAVAVQAGAQDYLNKNEVNQALLERTLRYAIDRQHSRLALQASEQRSRQIIDQNSTAILVLSLNRVILFANPAVAKLYDCRVDELLGTEFSDPVELGSIVEITIPGPSHQAITAEMEVSQITWENQLVYLVSLHDVTARNAAERARQREQQLTEALSELYKPLISPAASLNDIAQEILRRACQLISSSAGFISSFDPENAHAAQILVMMIEQEDQLRLVDPSSAITIPQDVEGHFMGLWGRALNTRTPYFINRSDEIIMETVFPNGHLQINRFLAVPVLLGERLVGQMALANARDDYNDEDISAARRLVEFYGLAIQRWENDIALRKALAAEREQRELAETMRDVVSILVSAPDQETIFHRLLEQVSRVVPFDEAVIYLLEGEMTHAVSWLGYERFHPGMGSDTNAFPVKSIYNLSRMIETGLPVVNSDTYNHPDWVVMPQTAYVRSYAGVPIRIQKQVIGFLNVHSTIAGLYNQTHLERLSIFGDEVAIALDNARLLEETRRRVSELEVINKVSASLRLAETLDEIMPVFMDGLLEVVGVTHGAIFLYDPLSNDLSLTVSRGLYDNISVPPIQPGEGMIGHVFETGETYYSSEIVNDLMVQHQTPGQMPAGIGGLCLPLGTARAIFGVLVLAFESSQPIAVEKKNLVETLADIAGNTFHRMRLFEETEIRLQYLSALRTIDLAIATSFDLRVTLNVVLEQTLVHLSVDAADILLYNPVLQTLDYAASRGFNSRNIEQTHLQMGDGFAGQAALEGRIITLTNLRDRNISLNRFNHLVGERFITYMGVPLMIKGEIKGVLELFFRSPLQTNPEWSDFLDALSRLTAIAIDNVHLFDNLQHSKLELAMAYDQTLEGWANALDLRDRETERHTERVTELTVKLARRCGFSEEELVHIRRGSLLHDIGKVGVEDSILRKEGPLNEAEWVIMRKHPITARNLLKDIAYLAPAMDIPYCHHEYWNGKGYPRGLKGEQIPKAARVFFVVDVWDALSHERPYKLAWAPEKVLAFLREQAGQQFDPQVVEEFIRMMAEEYPDGEPWP